MSPQIVAQLDAAVATTEVLYECPAQHMADVFSLTCCNRGAAADAIRVSVGLAGATLNDKQYLYYDLPVEGKDTFMAAIGLTLRAGDLLRVYSTTGTTSFSLLGEVTYPVQAA